MGSDALPCDSGISLLLELPLGRKESISVRSSDLGSKVWSALQTLSAIHRFKLDGFQCLRPDGHPLDFHEKLSAQGLRDGSKLHVREQPKLRKHETIVVNKEDFQDAKSGNTERLQIEPHLWSREDREVKATDLKQKANDALKEGGYPEAREMYSAALAWLPPEDSDVELVAALFGNRALTHLKLERWEDAKADAEKSLRLLPGNLKVEYRLGLAAQALGDLGAAEQSFKHVLEKDPDDRVVKHALLNVQNKMAKEAQRSSRKPVEKETPKGMKWRLGMWQQGFKLPRLQHIWRDLHTGTSTSSSCALPIDHATALSQAWRHQPPLNQFFHNSLTEMEKTGPLHVIVLGTGNMAAVKASADLRGARFRNVTVLEPSKMLLGLAEDTLRSNGSNGSNLRFVQSPGQLDSEFSIPASVFPDPPDPQSMPDSNETNETNETCVLMCDRLSEDLVGERLISTMKAGKDAARRLGSKVMCLPATAELVCAPLELRCVECLGFDTSKANALRFTAHAKDVPPASTRVWKCEMCSWRNVPQAKACELCRGTQRQRSVVDQHRARRQDSSGWWPLDLDTEAKRAGENGCICRLCGKEQIVCSFDFNEATFEQQCFVLDRTFEAKVLQHCHVNAIAAWWRLRGPGGAVDTGPEMAGNPLSWPAKRQAVFYLGYEVGVEQDEVLRFRMQFSDEKSRIHFEMLEPRLVDRMGLIKFHIDIVNEKVLEELHSKLDVKTNRLSVDMKNDAGGGSGAPLQKALKRGDKLLTFGPFDLVPDTLTEDVWKRVRDRLERHSSRPKRGDQPIRCTFQHGVFEGTRRWPLPTLCDGAIIPRQPSFFEHFGLSVTSYLALLEWEMQDFVKSHGRCPQILELHCGPVPLLSMCASRQGARAWAVEAIPDLRDLALETVRDYGLEMTFQQPGLANYRFFGGKMPGDPAVRILKPLLSTSMEIGDPKCLDGDRADLVVCRPESGGPLGLDYLETMWHAFEELLKSGGRLVPSTLVVRVMAVEWMPWVDASAESTCYLQPIFGLKHQQVLLEDLKPLTSQATIPIDLTSRLEPDETGELEVHQAGLVTAFALWHEPHSPALPPGKNKGYVTVCFVTPQMVNQGQRIPFHLSIQECELTAALPRSTEETCT